MAGVNDRVRDCHCTVAGDRCPEFVCQRPSAEYRLLYTVGTRGAAGREEGSLRKCWRSSRHRERL